MATKIKIGETVDTPNGRGVVVKAERWRQFTRWGVLLDESPFKYNPVFYNHKLVIPTNVCDCKYEYNDDHHGTLIYRCSKCK